MNTTTINIRISDILKEQIEELSIENDQSISEVTRSIIEGHFNNTNELIDDTEHTTIIKQNDDLDIIQTFEFTRLIFWIYDKRSIPEITEFDEFCHELIDIISKFKSHPLFPDEIVNEFNKISNELNLHLSNNHNGAFYFPIPDTPFSFNYELFAEFFYCITYNESENNYYIHEDYYQ